MERSTVLKGIIIIIIAVCCHAAPQSKIGLKSSSIQSVAKDENSKNATLSTGEIESSYNATDTDTFVNAVRSSATTLLARNGLTNYRIIGNSPTTKQNATIHVITKIKNGGEAHEKTERDQNIHGEKTSDILLNNNLDSILSKALKGGRVKVHKSKRIYPVTSSVSQNTEVNSESNQNSTTASSRTILPTQQTNVTTDATSTRAANDFFKAFEIPQRFGSERVFLDSKKKSDTRSDSAEADDTSQKTRTQSVNNPTEQLNSFSDIKTPLLDIEPPLKKSKVPRNEEIVDSNITGHALTDKSQGNIQHDSIVAPLEESLSPPVESNSRRGESHAKTAPEVLTTAVGGATNRDVLHTSITQFTDNKNSKLNGSTSDANTNSGRINSNKKITTNPTDESSSNTTSDRHGIQVKKNFSVKYKEKFNDNIENTYKSVDLERNIEQSLGSLSVNRNTSIIKNSTRISDDRSILRETEGINKARPFDTHPRNTARGSIRFSTRGQSTGKKVTSGNNQAGRNNEDVILNDDDDVPHVKITNGHTSIDFNTNNKRNHVRRKPHSRQQTGSEVNTTELNTLQNDTSNIDRDNHNMTTIRKGSEVSKYSFNGEEGKQSKNNGGVRTGLEFSSPKLHKTDNLNEENIKDASKLIDNEQNNHQTYVRIDRRKQVKQSTVDGNSNKQIHDVNAQTTAENDGKLETKNTPIEARNNSRGGNHEVTARNNHRSQSNIFNIPAGFRSTKIEKEYEENTRDFDDDNTKSLKQTTRTYQLSAGLSTPTAFRSTNRNSGRRFNEQTNLEAIDDSKINTSSSKTRQYDRLGHENPMPFKNNQDSESKLKELNPSGRGDYHKNGEQNIDSGKLQTSLLKNKNPHRGPVLTKESFVFDRTTDHQNNEDKSITLSPPLASTTFTKSTSHIGIEKPESTTEVTKKISTVFKTTDSFSTDYSKPSGSILSGGSGIKLSPKSSANEQQSSFRQTTTGHSGQATSRPIENINIFDRFTAKTSGTISKASNLDILPIDNEEPPNDKNKFVVNSKISSGSLLSSPSLNASAGNITKKEFNTVIKGKQNIGSDLINLNEHKKVSDKSISQISLGSTENDFKYKTTTTSKPVIKKSDLVSSKFNTFKASEQVKFEPSSQFHVDNTKAINNLTKIPITFENKDRQRSFEHGIDKESESDTFAKSKENDLKTSNTRNRIGAGSASNHHTAVLERDPEGQNIKEKLKSAEEHNGARQAIPSQDFNLRTLLKLNEQEIKTERFKINNKKDNFVQPQNKQSSDSTTTNTTANEKTLKLTSDDDPLIRGEKKFTPSKYETISTFTSDSKLNEMYKLKIEYSPSPNQYVISSNAPRFVPPVKVEIKPPPYRGKVKYEEDPDDVIYDDIEYPPHFSFRYKTPTGISAYQQGTLTEIDNTQVYVVHGSYQYTAPDGTPILVTYTADENGFHPEMTPLVRPSEETELQPENIIENDAEFQIKTETDYADETEPSR